MAARGQTNTYTPNKTKHPGVHAKSGTARQKQSKNYKKAYNRQGR